MPHFLTLSFLTLIGCQASSHIRLPSRRAQAQDNICGSTATCTQSVLDTLACNDQLGGCHTCGSRIEYLIHTFAYTPSDACALVGFSQFMTECGGCMPDHHGTPGKNLKCNLVSNQSSCKFQMELAPFTIICYYFDLTVKVMHDVIGIDLLISSNRCWLLLGVAWCSCSATC